ncbi:FxSxx-COOH system tetratricopeptide repeat protein [Verrucosispora sp. WMMD573]|uniref:FxSxx-COOH system tetratricopeptide repeat protein n=1 Tax=Verrucosispora sp. WMMD573 TaxID=3015149 RepID=UPI00248C1324|nr:FxSxx-COOH system tetratricopeptide repeat protein [Verrucosispora sp. WMMD573]WBB56675.1 FxSxx-COOH system tetratricopeptide repeat protein [Verrucosispora sp. WMMD573]
MTSSDPVATATGREGRIITFYSYKGGTGRTMALANVAWILAANGHRVLAVDWDLESPGLHRYFHPFLLDKDLRTSRGVIDMARDYADAAIRPVDETEDPDWISTAADVLRHAVSLDWPFPPPHRDITGSDRPGRPGFLDLLPAGRQDPSYTKAVSTFDWQAFFEKHGGTTFLTELAASMRANYDYVLIDSRTGVGDSAGICTVRLPDAVVTSFTLNEQSIDGAAAVARSIVRQRGDRPVRILPVPMRVDNAEQLKLEAGRDQARRRFTPLLPRLSPEESDRYWGEVEIPYQPYYAYEEILAAFGDRTHHEATLLAAYERLTRAITDGEVEELPPFDDRLRRTWLAKFERQRLVGAAPDVFVSYTALDRAWAEWICDELDAAGLRAVMREIDFPANPSGGDWAVGLDDAARLVVLLSQEYMQSPNAVELWGQAINHDLTTGYLVPVRLDNSRAPGLFVDRVPLDLVGVNDEQEATARLLEALGHPGRPAPDPEDAQRRHRFPGTEPPVWRVPLPRNVQFVGRGPLLEAMRDWLSGSDAGHVPLALHGLGGVGKSQIALEYAYRFRAEYDIVWWISAQQPSVLRLALGALADRLAAELDTPLSGNVSERVTWVLDVLRRGVPFRRWLLILDNADEPTELLDLIPHGPGHILVTTRNRAWARPARMLEVGAFDREESLALLRRRAGHLADGDADLIADRLGDLPLAIEQAGAWLATTGESPAQYLTRIRRYLPDMLAEELPPDYQKTGAQPWLVSLDSLRERNPAAAKLLEVCAFFASEPIPMSLITGDRFTSVLLPYDPSLRDSLLRGRMLRDIGRYALARIDSVRGGSRARGQGSADEAGQTSLSMHPLVQELIRESLSDQEKEQNRQHVHAILAAANPKDPDNPRYWPIYAELWPHLLPSRTLTSDHPEVRQLLLDVARYMWIRVDFATCAELAEQAIALWQQRYGPDDPQTLMMRFQLANALRLEARYQDAYDIDCDVYDRLRSGLGEYHEYTVIAAGSLAADLRALGHFERARELDVRTEELAREVFGEDHPRALIAAHNLAISLRLVGDLRGALSRNKRTLARRRETLGPMHPFTLFSAGEYGRDLRDTGDLIESRRVLEAAVEATRLVLGEEDPETLRALKNYAVTLRKLGELERAHALSTDVLMRSRRRHGPDHPDVQASAMNLACDESALGNDAGALRRARPVHRWYHDNMGEDHLFTLAYANNLAIFLRKAGDAEAAFEVSVEVVARLSERIGADHPYTLAANINLANCWFGRRQFTEALASDREAYERSRRILGPGHPDTLAVANNLATSLSVTGDHGGARSLREQVMPLFRRVLGEEHPNTIALVEANRLNCDLEPPPT